MYMAALDGGSKAFDRVNHYSLFMALMKLETPLPYLNVIIHWHLRLFGLVRWCGCFSKVFEIKSGIRQGGISSPSYFNVFINDLIVKLRKCGLGCFVCNIFCGCMLFADDILLLSGSLSHLQLMLDICVNFADNNDIMFNHKKSNLFQIGLSADTILPQLSLGCNELKWISELKYLGVVFMCGKKLLVNTDLQCRKFLGTAFALLQKCGHLSEEILCKVILTHCLPLMLYGVDSIFITKDQIRKLSVAFNTAFRRVFHMSRFSSMRLLYSFMGFKTLDCLYEERLMCLIRNCSSSECELLRMYSELCFARCWDICLKYDVHPNLSIACIKRQVWCYFHTILIV